MSVWPSSATVSSAALLPWLGRLATLAMLGLLAWLLATIFWSLSAPETPRPATAMQTDAQQVVQVLVPRHLFGIAAPAAAEVNATVTDIRLNGTIAAQKAGQAAYAILAIEGKTPQLVKEGAEVMPGVKLQHVLSRQVELLRNGQSQMLSLPESGKAGAGQSPAHAAAPVQPVRPAQAVQSIPAVQAVQPVQAVQSPPLPEPGTPARRRGKRIWSTDDDS